MDSPGRYDFSVMPARADTISRSDSSRDQNAMRCRYSGVIISRFSSICCNAADKPPAASKIDGELSGKRQSVVRLYPMQVVTPNRSLGLSVIAYGIRDTSLFAISPPSQCLWSHGLGGGADIGSC